MILTTIGLIGFGFTIPEIFVLLVKFGVLKTRIMAKNRVRFYFILYIVTAIITPDGGPLADAALFFTMVLLWEVALLIAKRYEKESPISTKVTDSDKTKKCVYCGQTIDDSDVFCKKCGKSQQ